MQQDIRKMHERCIKAMQALFSPERKIRKWTEVWQKLRIVRRVDSVEKRDRISSENGVVLNNAVVVADKPVSYRIDIHQKCT